MAMPIRFIEDAVVRESSLPDITLPFESAPGIEGIAAFD
jgi:hypothetical protein